MSVYFMTSFWLGTQTLSESGVGGMGGVGGVDGVGGMSG